MIDSLKKKHEAAMANTPDFADGDRHIWIAPAYEILKDPDDGKDYGRHGMTIHFALRQGDRAVSTEFYTCYQTNGLFTRRMVDIDPDMLCTGLYYHYHTKEAGVSEYAREGTCHLFSGGKCWGEAGSALHGDDISKMLINEGSEVVFRELERAIKEGFEPDDDDAKEALSNNNASQSAGTPDAKN